MKEMSKELKDLFELIIVIIDNVKRTFVEDFKELEKKISASEVSTNKIKDNTIVIEKRLLTSVENKVSALAKEFETKINKLDKDLYQAIDTAKKESDSSEQIKKLVSDFEVKFNTLKKEIANIELLEGNPGEKGDTFTFNDLTKDQKEELKGKDGSPDDAEDIRNKLELLTDDERLDKKAIKGLEELENKLNKIISEKAKPIGSVSGRDIFADLDISDQLDGVAKTFNIPAIYNIISVSLSSFPNALRKGVDFTYTPTSITFTNEINASTSLATGQTCVLTVVNA